MLIEMHKHAATRLCESQGGPTLRGWPHPPGVDIPPEGAFRYPELLFAAGKAIDAFLQVIESAGGHLSAYADRSIVAFGMSVYRKMVLVMLKSTQTLSA